MTTSHSEKTINTKDKPIASYIINKTKSKFKRSIDIPQSHNDTQILRQTMIAIKVHFQIFDNQEEERFSIDGDSSFDSSFDEIDTAEINEE